MMEAVVFFLFVGWVIGTAIRGAFLYAETDYNVIENVEWLKKYKPTTQGQLTLAIIREAVFWPLLIPGWWNKTL